ncbi:hypothetical protein ACOMHN_049405 [Nucella lapillus]
MDKSLSTERIKSDVNWEPWSDKISLGKPTRENTLSKASATDSELISFSGIASGYRVAKSTHVRIYLCFLSDEGASGPTKSMPTRSNGVSMEGMDSNGADNTFPLGKVFRQ